MMRWLVVFAALFAIGAIGAMEEHSDYDYGNDVFQIRITGNPDKAGNPKYSFSWYVDDETTETYDVAWEKVYETPCSNLDNPSGNKMVNLNSIKWDYNFNDSTEIETFSMESGAVDSKLYWSNLRFDQGFNASSELSTHMKFSVYFEDYKWQDNSDDSCLMVEMSLQDANDSLAVCDQVNVNTTMVGNSYVQQLPDQAVIAVSPDGTQTAPVNFQLACGSGSTIKFVYGTFPSGWTLLHDPNIGVNSNTDPMYGVSSPTNEEPASETPWGLIGLGIAMAVIAMVVILVAIVGLVLIRRSGSGSYDEIAEETS